MSKTVHRVIRAAVVEEIEALKFPGVGRRVGNVGGYGKSLGDADVQAANQCLRRSNSSQNPGWLFATQPGSSISRSPINEPMTAKLIAIR